MRAGELCVRDVATATADESVVDAARRMASFGVGDLVVVDGTIGDVARPIGIVTDRDLVVRVLAHPELDAAATRISQILGGDLIVAYEDDDVESVIAKMREYAVRRIPVIDKRGGLQGVISVDDVLGWMREQIETATHLLERQGVGPLLFGHGAAPIGIK